jgi:hypothetical protein
MLCITDPALHSGGVDRRASLPPMRCVSIADIINGGVRPAHPTLRIKSSRGLRPISANLNGRVNNPLMLEKGTYDWSSKAIPLGKHYRYRVILKISFQHLLENEKLSTKVLPL